MPRRPTSAVRADLPYHPRRTRRLSIIDGLSGRVLADIHRWERRHAKPGIVALDLAHWRREVERKSSRSWHGYVATDRDGICTCGICDEYDIPSGRWGLEAVLSSLPRTSRRELAVIVGALDSRLLASTYGSEPDGPGWWQRRL